MVFGLLVVAGVLAVVASAQAWWRARAEGADVAFTGTETTGGLSQALAVVVLVGVVLALTLGVRGRRVLAVLLALAAVGVMVLAALGTRPSSAAVESRVRQVSLTDQFDLTATAWPWIFGVAGLLGLLGAVLLARAAGSWPRRAPRYERTRAALAGSDPAHLEADPLLAWRALDEGVDPTSTSDRPGAPGPDPDVHEEASRDTMGGKSGPPPG